MADETTSQGPTPQQPASERHDGDCPAEPRPVGGRAAGERRAEARCGGDHHAVAHTVAAVDDITARKAAEGTLRLREAEAPSLAGQAAELEVTAADPPATTARLEEQTEARDDALRRLAASEARFRALFERAAVGMGRVGFTHARWLEVNDAFCAMLGYSREAMLATPWPEITHPEDVDLDLVPFRRMAAGELDAYTVEKRFVHARGHHVWARLTLSLVRDAAGRPDYEIAVIEDITARRQIEAERERLLAAERTARERTERLQALTAALSEAVTPDDVVHVAVEQGLRALGADAGLVMLRGVPASDASGSDASGEVLRLAEWHGYGGNQPAAWRRVPLDAVLPVAEAVRSGRAVVLRSRAERAARFPTVAAPLDEYEASVALPLTGHGGVLGALAVDRRVAGDLGEPALAFIEAFARQCGQALERARLHEAAERARREAESAATALEEARRWRDAALLAGEIGTFAWDTVRQRVWGDANFARMFGIALETDGPDAGTAPLDRYIDVIHPDDRARMRAAVARTVDGGADYEVEYRVVGTDAQGHPTVRWLLVRAKPERDAAGRVVHAPGVCLDVTARKEAEDALRRSTTLLQAITDATGDVIYAKDADGRLTYGNPATFALIGRSADEALGHTDAEFLGDPDAARRVMENDRRVMTTGQAQEVEEVVPLPDGTHRVWASYKMPYRDEHGAVIGLLGVSRDVTERAEARRRLAAALTAGEVGTYEWDVVADRVYGDANFARLFGLALGADGSAPLQAYLDAIHPEDRPEVVARITRTLEDGVPYEAEYRIVGAAGPDEATDARWVIARGVVERDPATGAPLRLPGTILDITGRKAAEQALERERALLGAILDQMPIGVSVAESPGGRLSYMNAAGVRLLGHPPLEAPTTEGYARYGAVHADGTPYTAAEYPLARALAGETLVEQLMRYHRGDGAVVVLAVSAAPVYDASGRLVRAVCAWSDVTERIALEDALRDARQRLESIIHSIDDGLLVIDHEWRYTYFSERAAEIAGVRRADMLGGVVWDLYPHARGTKFHDGFHRAVESGQPVHFEEFYPEPVSKWLECHCYPGPEGLTVFFRDVTERKAAEVERERLFAAAEEANRAKGAFLANMSHELRTPLNAIGGHVQLMEMGLHGPVTDAQAEALGRVQRAQRHLLALINDVLNYAKLEAGKVEFDVQPTRVADVVHEVVPLLEPQVRAKGLVLDVALQEGTPDAPAADAALGLVWADREKLAQTLLNLLANAVKFTPARQASGAPGRITVSLLGRPEAPDVAELRVHDTGIGIPADKQEAIFDPFVQVSAGLTRHHEGTGLGLAISRDLARGMGGDLRVESVEGAGSTFTVALRRVVSATHAPLDRRSRDERRDDGDRRGHADRRQFP